MTLNIHIFDRFEVRRLPLGDRINVYSVTHREVAHRADLILFVDYNDGKSYIEIVKFRPSGLDQWRVKAYLNTVHERFSYLIEMSKFVESSFIHPYDLKNFIINELTNKFGDEVNFLKSEPYKNYIS